MLKLIFKIFTFILSALLCIFLLAFGGGNVAKFIIYNDYYDIESEFCKNPGLSDGFVCQGICAYEQSDGDKIFVSGYMKDKSASRIYVTDVNDNSYYVSLLYENKPFTGHSGGICHFNDNVYVACNSKLYPLPVQTLLQAKNGDVVHLDTAIPVNSAASFAYVLDEYVYVGEFNDGGKHQTEHPYQTPDGVNHAIVSQYSIHDLSAPKKVYSIRDRVQGICFTPDGKIVLSTSFGITSSIYYVYDESKAVQSNQTLDGAPVYFLGGCQRQIKGPAMGQGLDYYKGKILTLTEAASDKYIFGKFFFANDIVLLNL